MSCVTSNQITPAPVWVEDGGFLILLAAVTEMCWGMAYVCEEYSVPAITVFCKRNNYSDDIAGAIFIGAGLSLPVLFASFVGLFVSQSSIGAATVVGGNVFNNLLNVGWGIMVAPNRRLEIDAVVFTRENIFYFFTCILVIWAAKGNLSRSISRSFIQSEWTKCLHITIVPGIVLIVAYFLYCYVEIYFDKIKTAFLAMYQRYKRHVQNSAGSNTAHNVINNHSNLTSNSNSSHGPPAHNTSSDSEASNDTNLEAAGGLSTEIIRDDVPRTRRRSISNPNDLQIQDYVERGLFETEDWHATRQHTEVGLPTLPGSLNEARNDRIDHILTDFSMYMRSSFYENNDFTCLPSSRKWNLRYFTFNAHGLFYKLEFHLPMQGSHVRFIDVFDLEQVIIENRELMEFQLTLRSTRKVYSFRTSSVDVFEAITAKLRSYLEEIKVRSDDELRAMALKAMTEMVGLDGSALDPDSESIEDTQFTIPSTFWRKVWFYFTLPLKLMVYYTTPDVRKPGFERYAILSTMISFAWLAAMTYVLIDSLTLLANLMKINGSVLGITIGAWAASYPAAWSTVVVARHGFGDIAVCNALGSNVFANLLGLGLPWFVAVLAYQKPYDVLQDQGLVMSIFALIFIMLFLYVMVARNNWVLEQWMVPIIVTLYFAFIIFFVYFTLTYSHLDHI